MPEQLAGLNTSIILSVMAGVAAFYIVKSIVNSVLKGIIFAIFISLLLFGAAIWFVIGVENFIRIINLF